MRSYLFSFPNTLAHKSKLEVHNRTKKKHCKPKLLPEEKSDQDSRFCLPRSDMQTTFSLYFTLSKINTEAPFEELLEKYKVDI
jgi:hypothetical protein